jgi:hypothetical protein
MRHNDGDAASRNAEHLSKHSFVEELLCGSLNMSAQQYETA